MDQFHTTAKGTKLPLRDIRGKLYMDVAYRVVWMREEHPDWQIHTNIVHADERGAMFRAVVIDSQGKTLATGHRFQDKSFSAFYEKAESQAIGRALALAGYGTAHALADFDDGDEPSQLPDSPVDRRPTVTASNSGDPSLHPINFGKYKGQTLGQIGMDAAINYADFLRRSDKPSQQSMAFVRAVDQWVAKSNPPQPESLDAPPDWVTEDVP